MLVHITYMPRQLPGLTGPVAEQRARGANRGAARCRDDSRTVFRWPVQEPQGSSATVHALASVWADLSCLSLRAHTVGPWIPLPRVVMVERAVALNRTCTACQRIPASPEAPPSVVVKGAEGDRASCTCPLPLAGHQARGTGVAADFMISCPAGDPPTWILHRTFLYHTGSLRLLPVTV